MHSSISVILLDAKRGTVIAPISLHSLSACECLIALGSFRNAQFGETLGTTFYSIRQPDRSPIPIAYGRGHPFEPIAGSSLAELPPQGINVATKRLHQEYRRRSPTTAAAVNAAAIHTRIRQSPPASSRRQRDGFAREQPSPSSRPARSPTCPRGPPSVLDSALRRAQAAERQSP